MKYKLPVDISSPQDLASLITEIQQYARWFSHESIKKQVGAARSSEAPLISKVALETIRSLQSKDALTRSDLDALISFLTETKQKSPSVTLTLAAPPTKAVKQELVSWCRENIAPDILVTFQFNSTILGGMVVRTRSHVYDWSFRRHILEERYKFPGVLRRV